MDTQLVFLSYVHFLHFKVIFCEFREDLFRVYESKRLDNQYTLLTKSDIRSKEQCAAYCLEVSTCLSVSYHREFNQCKLSSKSPAMQSGVLNNDLKWMVLDRTYKFHDKWINQNNYSFLISEVCMTWMDAQDHCQRYNSSMVETRNDSINTAMHKALSVAGHTNKGSAHAGHFFWIGGKGKGHDFVWSSDDSTIIIQHWNPGQSDSSRQTEYNGYCIEMLEMKQFGWNSANCSETNMFICARPNN